MQLVGPIRTRIERSGGLDDVDAIIAPATPCGAPLLGQKTFVLGGVELPVRANLGVFTQPISFIGLPVVTVPVAGPLPVGVQNPAECLHQVARAMEDLKKSGQAIGAQVLTNLAGFAPPTILSQAARLQARQRFFNLVVTNVPGPQFPLYVLGRRLKVLYPVVPLARRQALGIAVMSYDGHLGFGLLADFDALPELEAIGQDLKWAIASLARAAGLRPARKRSARKASTPGKDAKGTPASAAAGRRSPSKRASAS